MRTKKIRRLTGGVAVLAAAGLALAGCGVGGGGGTPASTKGDADAPEADGEVTGEISFQTWNLKAGFQEYFDGVIAGFEEEYPGTKVNWIDQPADGYADKLSADAAAGTLPDVINLDAGTGYALGATGHLLNISEVDPEAKDLYLERAWDSLDWKALGGNFAYPWYLNTGPALFNKALFEEAGLDSDNLPRNYDELFDQANEMAAAAGGDFAMLGNTPIIEHFGMYGVELMNADQTEYTFNNDKGVEFVNRYKELYDNGGLLPEALSQNYTGVDDNFQSARIAYMPGSAYNIEQIRDNAPSVYESLAFQEAIYNTDPNMYIQAVGVNANTKNQATALAFARWVTNADNQLAFAKEVNIFPSTAGTLDDPFFTESDGTDVGDVRVLAAEQLKTAVVFSPPTWTEPMKAELREQIANALMGNKSVEEALDAAVAYANDRMSDY